MVPASCLRPDPWDYLAWRSSKLFPRGTIGIGSVCRKPVSGVCCGGQTREIAPPFIRVDDQAHQPIINRTILDAATPAR